MLSQMSNGCIHPERPAESHCSMCGKGICIDCRTREIVDQRLVGTSSAHTYATDGVSIVSTGAQYALDHAIYCPKCYLDQINKPDYKIMVESGSGKFRTMDVKKPTYFGRNGETIGNYIIFLLCVPNFGCGFLLFWMSYSQAKDAYETYLYRKSKAESIVKQMQIVPKREPVIQQSQIVPKRKPVNQQSQIAQTLQNLQTEETRYCGKCGAQKKSSQKFCSDCGSKME